MLGSQALYREWGYVAFSRGRQTNRLYQNTSDRELDEIHTHGHQPDDPHMSLAARMARTRAQASVTPEVEELAAQWRELRRRLHEPDIARSRILTVRRAELAAGRQHSADRLDHLQVQLEQAGRGLRRVRNRPRAGELRQAATDVSEQLATIDGQLKQLDTELARLPTPAHVRQVATSHAVLSRQLRQIAEARLAQHSGDPPTYLTAALGPRPHHGASIWDRAAVVPEDYRLRWTITDPERTFPAPPIDELQRDDFRQALQTMKDARRDLRTGQRERQVPTVRQRGLAR